MDMRLKEVFGKVPGYLNLNASNNLNEHAIKGRLWNNSWLSKFENRSPCAAIKNHNCVFVWYVSKMTKPKLYRRVPFNVKSALLFFVAGMSGPPERSFNFEGDALITFPFRLFHNLDRINTIIVFNSRRRTPKTIISSREKQSCKRHRSRTTGVALLRGAISKRDQSDDRSRTLRREAKRRQW
jgi:hypothetical protein